MRMRAESSLGFLANSRVTFAVLHKNETCRKNPVLKKEISFNTAKLLKMSRTISKSRLFTHAFYENRSPLA